MIYSLRVDERADKSGRWPLLVLDRLKLVLNEISSALGPDEKLVDEPRSPSEPRLRRAAC